MPKRLTRIIPGHYYHIYNKAVADNQLFIEEKNYHFFLSKIKKYLLNTSDVLAFCLMPNHYHLVIKLKNPEMPRSMQQLAMSYTMAFNKMYQRSGHLFQGRYQLKHIGEDVYLEHLTRYIHLNPLIAGLVSKPENWEYSSYCEYVGLREPDFINRNIVLDRFGITNVTSLEKKQKYYQKYVEDWDS